MSEHRPTIAVFRPADDRLATATETLSSLGLDPIADPMLAVEPTGAMPRDAEFVVLTSKTGAELVAANGWEPGDATVAAIGASTAEALEAAGYPVDVVPAEYSSRGLVERLRDEVAGATIEVARSDHGSPVLLEGLRDAGATVHETVLYRLTRPSDAGDSTEKVAAGEVDGVAFTSSLTVEHVLAAAEERGIRDVAIAGLSDAVVGAIGEPTRETAAAAGIHVDVVPETADFRALAHAIADRLGTVDEPS